MNKRDALWAISSDIITLFKKDFGPFEGIAKKIAYENIQKKPQPDIDQMLSIISMRLKAIDE